MTYIEVSFGCNGTVADMSVEPAVNVQADPSWGEIRIPPGIFSFRQAEAQIYSERLGALVGAPTCTIEDSGEPAYPSWNVVKMDSGANLDLAQTATGYTLIAHLASGANFTVSW